MVYFACIKGPYNRYRAAIDCFFQVKLSGMVCAASRTIKNIFLGADSTPKSLCILGVQFLDVPVSRCSGMKDSGGGV